jgi:hypothetical protein
VISILLADLLKAGAIQAVGSRPPKRFGQRFELTKKGREQLLEMDNAISDLRSGQSLPDQVAQETTSKKSEAQDPASDDGVETGIERVHKVCSELFPDRVKRYKDRLPKVNRRH